MVSQIFSLAAAGALLLSTAAAETYDVRAQVLHDKFGLDLASRMVRRQDESLNSTDDTLSSIASSATADITSLSSSLPSRTTGLITSRTLSASSTGSAFNSDVPYWSGPDEQYIIDMCLPNFLDEARASRLGIELTSKTQEGAYLEGAKLAISLGGSPYPCEQAVYIEYACHANATKPADYLAEQQCYCGSTFFDADQACNDCFLAHGLVSASKQEYGDRMDKFSEKVCDATPVAGGVFAAAKTMLPDAQTRLEWASKSVVQHPSSTAVSLYATLPALSVPALTGEATARATNWGNWPGVKGSEATNSGSGATNAAVGGVVPIAGAVLGAMMLGAGLVL